MSILKELELVREFLDSELSDWDWKYDIEYDPDSGRNFDVDFPNDVPLRCVYFRVNDNEELEVELGEDSWHEVRIYDSSVKYFWISAMRGD